MAETEAGHDATAETKMTTHQRDLEGDVVRAPPRRLVLADEARCSGLAAEKNADVRSGDDVER